MSLARSNPVAFFGEGFEDFPKDSSSSAGIFALSRTIGFSSLSQVLGCFVCPLSCASPSPRLCLFPTWAWRRSFHTASA